MENVNFLSGFILESCSLIGGACYSCLLLKKINGIFGNYTLFRFVQFLCGKN